MKKCPCCSEQLLRHARHDGVYLFCTHCWQEMPDLVSIVTARYQGRQRSDSLMHRLVPVYSGAR